MQAYRVETTVEAGGSLTVRDLPFLAGEKVEVIVLSNLGQRHTPEQNGTAEATLYPLRGTPVVFHDPYEPAVPESDWEVYLQDPFALAAPADGKPNPYPLRGTPYTYINPHDPVVPPEEWEALR